MYVCLVFTHAHEYSWRPEEDIESLELGLQGVVCHLIWVLGAKVSFSARAVQFLTAELSVQPLRFFLLISHSLKLKIQLTYNKMYSLSFIESIHP